MSQGREDLLRIAADILQERGIKLDEAELQRLLGVPPPERDRVSQHAAVHPHTATPSVVAAEVSKWPPLDNGTLVRTRLRRHRLQSADWTATARQSRRDGILGIIVGYHDAHGLTYEVRYLITPPKPPGVLARTFLSPWALAMREYRARTAGTQIGHFDADELVVVTAPVSP